MFSCLTTHVRLYWRPAGTLEPLIELPLAFGLLTPGAGTCPTAGGGELRLFVDRVDRRLGTAAQSISPATLSTAGIARRLRAHGSFHLDHHILIHSVDLLLVS